jgi:tellurite resistance protein
MDEDIFNMQVRKFLKQVGVNAQREIETAVRAALADGRLEGDEKIAARATISLDALGLSKDIEGTIELA